MSELAILLAVMAVVVAGIFLVRRASRLKNVDSGATAGSPGSYFSNDANGGADCGDGGGGCD